MRVESEQPFPARSPIFSDGVAGRSREGRGTRSSLVYSASSFRWYSAHVAYGGMPMWIAPPPWASSGRWLTAVVFMVVLTGGQSLPSSASSATPPISSPGSLFWRCSASSPASMVAVVVELKQGKDGGPDRVCAHPRWLLVNGYGAGHGAWLPAVSSMPSDLLAEGRPYFFLPAMEPIGRQCFFNMESAARCRGGFATPSGVVPGGGKVAFVMKVLGTRSRFSFGCGGPLCKMQGPVCYLGLVRGPFAYCCVPPLFYY